MFCSQCGKELPENSKFCVNCGDKIIASEKTLNNKYCTKHAIDFYDICPQCKEQSRESIRNQQEPTIESETVNQLIDKKNKLNLDSNQSSRFISKWPLIIGGILLLLALADWSNGYYVFLRITIFFICLYYIIKLFNKRCTTAWYLIFGAMAILYNPISLIYLYDKGTWSFLNIITVITFYIFYRLFNLAFYK